jgi:D-aminoacyl-tRNA deacylase
MRLVIQRILSGQISVAGQMIAKTNQSLAVFVGIEKDDSEQEILLGAKKIDGLRVFEDDAGKMNLSLPKELPLLMIPQFTLLGSLHRGFRPDFTQAEMPEKAKAMYEKLLHVLKQDYHRTIESGQFAADMEVQLTINGPVTLIFDTRRNA